MDQGPGGSGKPRRSRADPPDNAYWRENTLWGRITVKGREIRWSLRTSNAAVARRRIEDRRKLEVAKAHFGEVRHTYADVMDAWSEIIVKKVGAGTANRYGVSLKQLEPWLKDAFFDEIDRELIKEIANERMKKVKVATVRRDLTALSNLFEFAFDENIVDRNYALERMKALKERRDPIILPEHRHIDMVIARAPKSLAAMARVALNEGARQAEIVYARRSRIDHYRRELYI